MINNLCFFRFKLYNMFLFCIDIYKKVHIGKQIDSEGMAWIKEYI